MSKPAVVFSLGFEYDWKIGGYDYLEYMSRPEAFKIGYHLKDEYKDFITCVAWRQTAEFVAKYFQKGSLIALEGNLRSRTYSERQGLACKS